MIWAFITGILITALLAFVTVEIVRTEIRRRKWKRECPKWWGKFHMTHGVRQSVRLIDERAQAEILEMRDPRRVGSKR